LNNDDDDDDDDGHKYCFCFMRAQVKLLRTTIINPPSVDMKI